VAPTNVFHSFGQVKFFAQRGSPGLIFDGNTGFSVRNSQAYRTGVVIVTVGTDV
jgi:hypothetical protein